MCRLISLWNELKKAPFFPQVFSASSGSIFGRGWGRTNNDESYKGEKEEQVGREFKEENNFLEIRGRISEKCVKGILEFGVDHV